MAQRQARGGSWTEPTGPISAARARQSPQPLLTQKPLALAPRPSKPAPAALGTRQPPPRRAAPRRHATERRGWLRRAASPPASGCSSPPCGYDDAFPHTSCQNCQLFRICPLQITMTTTCSLKLLLGPDLAFVAAVQVPASRLRPRRAAAGAPAGTPLLTLVPFGSGCGFCIAGLRSWSKCRPLSGWL